MQTSLALALGRSELYLFEMCHVGCRLVRVRYVFDPFNI